MYYTSKSFHLKIIISSLASYGDKCSLRGRDKNPGMKKSTPSTPVSHGFLEPKGFHRGHPVKGERQVVGEHSPFLKHQFCTASSSKTSCPGQYLWKPL